MYLHKIALNENNFFFHESKRLRKRFRFVVYKYGKIINLRKLFFELNKKKNLKKN